MADSSERGKRARDEEGGNTLRSVGSAPSDVTNTNSSPSPKNGSGGFTFGSSSKKDKNGDQSASSSRVNGHSNDQADGLAAVAAAVLGGAPVAIASTEGKQQKDDDDDDDEDGIAALLAFAGTAAVKETAKMANLAKEVTAQAEQRAQALLTDDIPPPLPSTKDQGVTESRALVLVTDGDPIDSDDEKALNKLQKQDAIKKKKEQKNADAKTKHLKLVDHSLMHYEDIKTDFFIPPSEAANLTPKEVENLRVELDGAKVFGRDPPPPIKTWEGIGLSEHIMERLLVEKNFQRPFAIQSLAIPVLMSGRNLVAIAKTGSGKTLAFLLPLLRHCEHQFRETHKRSVAGSKGPLGLVLEPTRELADQVVDVCKTFIPAVARYSHKDGRPEHMRLCASYGGLSVEENIAACKAGCEIMVAAPGRLVDMLAANRGSVMNLSRCSFVVVDECDRMFDDGFGPHVSHFLKSTRPDRVVAMISSTLPPEIKKTIKQHVHDPIEISCGSKASPSSNVTQYVELFDDCTLPAAQNPRWQRLMQLLGERDVEERLVLIFMGKDSDCDHAMAELIKMGYTEKVAVLYSKMDQLEREMSLARFSKKDRPILIATGVAERGIDVPDLELVINYACPNHLESYIHRVGRTGRAGRRGTAYTFMTREKDNFMAAQLATALDESGNDVPEELSLLARGEMMAKKAKKKEQSMALMIINNPDGSGGAAGASASTGGGGGSRYRSNLSRGFKGKKSYGFDGSDRPGENGVDNNVAKNNDGEEDGATKVKPSRKIERVNAAVEDGGTSTALILVNPSGPAKPMSDRQQLGLSEAQQYADRLTRNANADEDDPTSICQTDYEINDLPQRIRSRIIATRTDIEGKVAGSSIVVKGVWVDPTARNSLLGRTGAATSLKAGERPLYFQIRAKTEAIVQETVTRIEAAISEETEMVARRESNFGARLPGR